jgi:hypothetical protein
MKRTVVVLSGLAMSALLTSCASSPSAQEQAKLIEYEACLTKQEVIQQELRAILFGRSTDLSFKVGGIFDSGKSDPSTGLITSVETMIKECEKYRP